MRALTKINKIKKMIENSPNGIISLKIGSSLENTAFEVSLGEYDELDLKRKITHPFSYNANYSIIKS